MKAKKSKPQQKTDKIPNKVILPDNLESSVKKVIEARQQMEDKFECLREPIMKSVKMANSVLESIKPQLDNLKDINSSSDYFIPARTFSDVRIVNPEDISSGSSKRESDVVVASYTLPKNATWESLDIKFFLFWARGI